MKTTYEQAINDARRLSKTMGEATVVRYWKVTQEFCASLLETAVKVDADGYAIMVASVDHKGKLTESTRLAEIIETATA